jgi:predicted DNA-binding transcriptional regulator YafY
VRPKNLLLHEGKWVLVCEEWVFENSDKDLKTLTTASIRLDYLRGAPRVGRPIEYTTKEAPPNALSSFGPSVGEKNHVVKLRIHGGRGVYFKKEKWHPTQEIIEEDKEAETLDLKFLVNDLRYFKFLVRRWLPHAEVLSPIELRNTLRQDIIQAMTIYR